MRKSELMKWVSVRKQTCKCRLLTFPVGFLEKISTIHLVTYLEFMITVILNNRKPR
jgi:hypothetical protein